MNRYGGLRTVPLITVALGVLLALITAQLALESRLAQPASATEAPTAERAEELDARAIEPSPEAWDRVARVAAQEGRVRVIAALKAVYRTEASLENDEVERQRSEYAALQSAALQALEGTD